MTRAEIKKPRIHFRQFGLRTFLIATTTAAVCGGFIGARALYMAHVLRTVPEIEKDGVQVLSDFHSRYGFYAYNRHGKRMAVLEWSMANPDYVTVLSPNGASDDLMKRISSLETVQDLCVSDVSLTGLQEVTRLRDLQSLSLHSSHVDDEVFQVIVRLPKLRRLRLVNSPVTDQGLRYLVRLHKLEEVQLLNTNVSRTGVRALISARPDLLVNASFFPSRSAEKKTIPTAEKLMAFTGTPSTDR